MYLPILENRFTYEDVRVFAEAVARSRAEHSGNRHNRTRGAKTENRNGLRGLPPKREREDRRVRLFAAGGAGASVSTPLKWEEFKKPLDPRDYTIPTVFKRIEKYGDLFAPVLTDRQESRDSLKALSGSQSPL